MIDMRKEAALALEEILYRGGYSSLIVNQHLKAFPATVSELDRRFFTGLVYTTLIHLISIDAIIETYSKVPLKKLKPYLLICLRLGICQLRYMDGTPDRAAIYQTVELVKQSRYHALAGYANGVLRTAQRKACVFPMPDSEREPVKALSLQYDMPEWIVQKWIKDYGRLQAEGLLQRMAEPGMVCVRVNTLKISPEEAREKLAGQTEVWQGILPEALYVRHTGDISKWELYKDGQITVQDESSMLAAWAVGAQPGERVLDLCGAPGGKSTFMAQLMQDQGYISCRDLHPHRVQLIEENQKRMGLSCIHAEAADGCVPRPEDKEAYDRVLLDAPCSGLGILRSKPDIKLHHTPEQEKELVQLQRQLLQTAASAVRPGGILVYSTCTLSKCENDDQIEWFLKKNSQFTVQSLEKRLPSLPECDRLWTKYLTLWPQKNGHDGFFVAALKKKG